MEIWSLILFFVFQVIAAFVWREARNERWLENKIQYCAASLAYMIGGIAILVVNMFVNSQL